MNSELTDNPEYWEHKKKHRLEGTQRIVRGRLGECPRGWSVTRIDLLIRYRTDGRPVAFGTDGTWMRTIRLDKSGFQRAPSDGRYAIAYCANVQQQHPVDRPWWPAVPWLAKLVPECEITVTIWAERGERVELDRMLDCFRRLPHAYPEWERRVKETYWIFKAYRRSETDPFSLGILPPPELPPVLVLQ